MAAIDDVKVLIDSIPGWTFDKKNGIGTDPVGNKFVVMVRSISTDAYRGADAAQIKIRMSTEECLTIIKAQHTNKKFFMFAVTPDTDSGKFNCGGGTYERLVVSIEGLKEMRNALSVRPALIEARDYFIRNPIEMIYRYFPNGGNEIPVGAITVIRAYSDVNALGTYLTNFDNRPYRNIVYSAVDYVQVDSNTNCIASNKKQFPFNWLISGAPGTGKSYGLDKAVFELIYCKTEEEILTEYINNDTSGASEDDKRNRAKLQLQLAISNYVHRVTFYEDYAYENFVGCYKPIPVENDATKILFDGKTGEMVGNRITYGYEPGPFIDILVKAYNDKNNRYCLIIEEINRAKAASVFGDIFQLLDRKEGTSIYSITPESALKEYLFEEIFDFNGELRIPNNLYIWATMNSADQGVYPLDSAFRRRWNYTCKDVYSPRCGNGAETEISFFFEGNLEKALWDDFRKIINVKIGKIAEEDKFLGPWYFSDEELVQVKQSQENVINGKLDENIINPLVDKLFLYLRTDVFRNDPEEMFVDGKNISAIIHAYYNGTGVLPSIETILNIDSAEFRKIII